MRNYQLIAKWKRNILKEQILKINQGYHMTCKNRARHWFEFSKNLFYIKINLYKDLKDDW